MILNKNIFTLVLGSLGIVSLIAPPASAAVRTVYFSQSGMNKTTNGLSPPGATSSCKITISNPSTQTQNFSLTMNVSSLDKWAGGDSGTSTAGSLCGDAGCVTNTTGATISCSGTTCSGTLNAATNVQVTYNFSAYPYRTTDTNTQNTNQKLRCAGTIVATDVAQPGFLIASGVLVTFVESAKMSTDGYTSGVTTALEFGGIAVYTQVPISINRAKPF